ncbi:MAG: histidinol dehydrogenase [Candidatus Bathyarchaeia archaeon]
MLIKIVRSDEARESILKDRWPMRRGLDLGLLKYAESIIEDVKRRGDLALVELTEKFDRVTLTAERLRVGREEIKEAYEKVSEEQISAIKTAKIIVEGFEKQILAHSSFEYENGGVRIRRVYRPIVSAGCYIPCGGAAYPSTVIMTVVPAKAAGVPRVVVCSPPRWDGEINPLTLAAADICGADEIYRVGGIQSVAAMAYGTETIKPVVKIVGPGNQYVLAAKKIISRDVPIDLPAGPSEIVILADEKSDPRLISRDMLSQAEHGVDSISMLVTTSLHIANNVVEEIKRLVEDAPNREVVSQSLERNGLIVVSESIDEAIDLINAFAPEHLEIMAENAYDLSERIHSAGLVLIGNYTPTSLSDYCLGTNHVLPTSGFGQVYSGLSALNFVRFMNIAECSRDTLEKLSLTAKVLAEGEGLLNHALAVEERIKG